MPWNKPQDLYKKSINLSELFFKAVNRVNFLNLGFYIESQRVIVFTNEDELLIFFHRMLIF